MVERALPEIARATLGPPPYTPDAWDRACQPYLGPVEARALYYESLSYGIIDRQERQNWRWRHSFFVDYLAVLGQGDTDD